MKNILFIGILFFASIQIGLTQNIKERVYLHINSKVLLTGEQLYFSAYCVSDKTGKPSPLSKVLYVEIVGNDSTVYREKIKLENGIGSGDFFISSQVFSGKYNLIAYTKWMKNFDEIFSTDLIIINPFEKVDAQPTEMTMDISVYPTSILSGHENTIAVLLKNIKPTHYTAKVINESGQQQAEFKIDEYGLGSFKYTPVTDEKYRVIIEDGDGTLSFHDLPASVEDGAVLNLIQVSDGWEVNFHTNSIENEAYVLSAKNGQGEFFTREINNSGTVKVSLKGTGKRGEELLKFDVFDQNKSIICQRLVSNGSVVTKIEPKMGSYGLREHVELSYNLDSGNYSVSVRKIDNIGREPTLHALNSKASFSIANEGSFDISGYISNIGGAREAFWLARNMINTSTSNEITHLPEFREELLSGRLVTKDKTPVVEGMVALSIPLEPYQLRVAKTNHNGEFTIPYQSTGQAYDSYVYPMSLDSAYELEIESSFLTKYPVFSYALPEFDSIQVMNNVNKSIRIQIENAYFTPAPRKDEPLNWSRQIIFDHKYILDDYTRFKTLKETFTEFIPQANVRNRRNPIIKAYFAFLPEEEKNQPLILLDGVFVSSEKLLEFNPYEIKSIELLNNRYYLGPHIADGVVDLKTVEGELGGFRLDENYHSMSNRGLKSSKVYSFPSYQNQLRDKIPDQRDQLYWNPSLRSRTDGRFGFSFYTSDVPGTYQVTVEGFNFSGEPITILESIQVIDEVK